MSVVELTDHVRYYKIRHNCSVSLQQETPTNELSTSAPTSPAAVSVKSTKLDLHGKFINTSQR